MSSSNSRRIDWDSVRIRLRHSANALSETMARSDEDLLELFTRRAEQLAKKNVAEEAASVSVLVFMVGKECYGIELTDLAEILPYQRPTPVPGSPAELLGLINLRGEICPLLNVARVLTLESDNLHGGYVLVVRTEGALIGLKVDRIERVRDLQPEAVLASRRNNAEIKARHLKGVTEDTLMLIDPAHFLRQAARSSRDTQE